MGEATTLQDVQRQLRRIEKSMVSKQELASLLETWEILHDPETMRQLRASEADIRAGRTKRIRNVKDLLAELDE